MVLVSRTLPRVFRAYNRDHGKNPGSHAELNGHRDCGQTPTGSGEVGRAVSSAVWECFVWLGLVGRYRMKSHGSYVIIYIFYDRVQNV